MDEGRLEYLRLHEALAKTNSPNDQPPFPDLDSFIEVISQLPADGDLAKISHSLYGRILRLAREEISKPY